MKKRKLFLNFFIILSLILSSFINVFATSSSVISKDEANKIAVKAAKEYFNIDIDDKKFETNIELDSRSYRDTLCWRIEWISRNNDKRMNINVDIDDKTGKIIAFDKDEYSNNDSDDSKIAKITEDEAKMIAENFIKKINPNEFKETRLSKDMYSMSFDPRYNFNFVRTVNNIDFDSNAITIGVNGISGKVESYSYYWDDGLDIPNKEGIISEEKASEILKNKLDLNLSYTSDYENQNKIKDAKLVYSKNFYTSNMIDSKKGIDIDFEGKEHDSNYVQKEKDISKEDKEKIYNSSNKIEKPNIEISEEEALKIMDEMIKEVLNVDCENVSIGYTQNNRYGYENRNIWEGQYKKKDSKHEDISIAIDANTKELLNINNYNYNDRNNEKFEPKLNFEQGYDKAIKIIERYYPNKIMDIDTKQKDDNNVYGKSYYQRYNYNFSRLVNEIPYNNDGINIEVNIKTGEIESISLNWSTNVNFQSKDKIINKDAAKDAYCKVHKASLFYFVANEEKENAKEINKKVSLVYMLKPIDDINILSIDATNGKSLDFAGKEINKDKEEFMKKIKNHFAEKQLSIMASKIL